MAEGKGNYRHGMYGTPTYKSWSEMKQRCNNPSNKIYLQKTNINDAVDYLRGVMTYR